MKALLEQVAERHPELAELDPASRRLALRGALRDVGGSTRTAPLVSDWIDGYGPLTELMREQGVTDVLVNGPDEVWVERRGSLVKTGVRFDSAAQLAELVERLLGAAGARADASVPIADARLSDGSRMHVVLPPITSDHAVVSIRRFPVRPMTVADLCDTSFLSDEEAHRLSGAVRARATIVIGGTTGAGKTTLVNALLACVGPDERIVVIEETPELRPVTDHWISLIARDPNVEGAGAIDQGALLRAALRMRPDRIVVGEVRGPEVLVALQAMSTGHEGSLLTVHSRSAEQIPDRLLDLALLAPQAPGEIALRRRIDNAIDVLVQVERGAAGRRVTKVIEL